MAEPVSSIVTLATVSLTIIQKIAGYIKDVREVNKSHLAGWHEWVKNVQYTCQDVGVLEDIPKCVLQIRVALAKCHIILKELKVEIMSLASRKTTSFVHKLLLKIHSDRSQGTIDKAIVGMERHGQNIQGYLILWNLQMTSYIRRQTSAAKPPQLSSIGIDSQSIATLPPTSEIPRTLESVTHHYLTRTLSDASTAFEVDFDSPSRRASSATQQSRRSMSSESSFAPSPVEKTIAERMNGAPADKRAEMDFHYAIQKCQGDKARSDVIEQKLKESSTLANSRNLAGRTPLHITAQFGDVELARLLIGYSADIDAEDTQSCSVLDMAIQKNQGNFVAFLLNQGAKESTVFKRNQRRLREMKQTIKLQKDMCR